MLRPLLFLVAVLGFLPRVHATAGIAGVVVEPARIELRAQDNEHGLLVTRVDAGGKKADATGQAVFASSAPEILSVDAAGRCRGLKDGTAEVDVELEGRHAKVAVVVSGMAEPRVPSFKQDILPILTRAGCNAGGCHGKQAGQNGFRLSLRGFAPEWDYEWLRSEVSARRINVAFPEESLLVQKPAGLIAHEGGTKFKPDSRYFKTLLDWIGARAPGPIEEEPNAVRLEVLPGDRELVPGQSQRLLVRAMYADGRSRDVTWLAQFFSNDETVVSIKPNGLAKALRAGETSVRVHFQGQVEAIRFTMPFAADVAAADFEGRFNALDAPIFAKLQGLRIPPSPVCDDQTFLRRAMLDATGTLPTPGEVAGFLADTRAGKRAALVESLLGRPEFTDYWTLQLADLLQNRKERDHDVRGTKGVRAFHAWLRGEVAANRPWDQIARSVLLASGSVNDHPEMGYFLTVVGEKNRVEESELPDSVAQSFLGTRIGCARCHNHPLEKYTQDDFYHFAAFFSKVSLKRTESLKGASVLSSLTREEEEQTKRVEDASVKLEPARELALALGEEPGAEEAKKSLGDLQRNFSEQKKRLAELQSRPPGVNQPRTGKRMEAQALDGAKGLVEPGADPRQAFVAWMLQSPNFSGAMVNRLWKHFFHVGLVEPVDDLRASNPPSNKDLWALLNAEFIGHGYDLKHVMRLILNSRAYQLSSETLAGNEKETRFYSHYYARRLPSEVISDGIAQASDVPVEFAGYPVGTRAIQLPDPGVGSYFLSLFGRSERVTACACERAGEVTLPQLLHLHNSDEIQRQLQSGDGRLKALLKNTDDRAVIDGLFLATASRSPRDQELSAISAALAKDGREAVFGDLFWALINSKEFTFNH